MTKKTPPVSPPRRHRVGAHLLVLVLVGVLCQRQGEAPAELREPGRRAAPEGRGPPAKSGGFAHVSRLLQRPPAKSV